MNVCVYCASSERVGPPFVEVATRLGRLLGERKNNLVYGGGNTGPILALARTATAAASTWVGVNAAVAPASCMGARRLGLSISATIGPPKP